jgi:acetyltransferase-like isoleucine patch superfamily enzyme
MISKLLKYKFKYLLNGSKVIIEPGGKFEVESNVEILNSTLYVGSGGYLKITANTKLLDSTIYIKGVGCNMQIGSNCSINNIDLSLWSGHFSLGNYSILENGSIGRKNRISVEGTCSIGEYNRIRSGIWVRFAGELSIGNRNAINDFTEIRCDEKVEIGDYNQISYECVIWDTNTHCIYTPEKRRKLTDSQYPGFGEETEKPSTKLVSIGNDCWLGKGVTLLKGSVVGDKCIVAFGTLISGKKIPDNSTVISKSTLQVSD